MEFKQKQCHRRLTRLKDYDYSQPGAYFITICTKERKCLFGEIENDQMRVNDYGEIVQLSWLDLPQHYPNVQLDAFVIMPNHVHGIIFLQVGAGFKPAPTVSEGKRHPLSEIVRAFKTFSSKHIYKLRNMPGEFVWQRNYYEHVIRRDESLNKIREYIENNPLRWALDRENPANQK
jgi:REP element-mobilizing transposase RayT